MVFSKAHANNGLTAKLIFVLQLLVFFVNFKKVDKTVFKLACIILCSAVCTMPVRLGCPQMYTLAVAERILCIFKYFNILASTKLECGGC